MRSARYVATLLGAGALLVGMSTAAAAAQPAQAVAVADCDGVTVVVDFSDLGGEVASGCAEGDPGSGREALESAGFVPVDSTPGLICTIDAQPDPCPTEFEGSYWAYWQLEDGEWVASQVGADEADPAPGAIEGWRYNDGSAPPPAVALEPSAAPTSESAADTASEEASEDASGGVSPAIWAVIAVVVLGVVVGLVIRRSRAGDAGT